jgi:hypothetical protein
MTYLTSLFRVFRFIQNYRTRQAELRAELRLEQREVRLHQIELLESIFDKVIEAQKVTNEGLLALAKAQSDQSQVMANWFKSFQADPTPSVMPKPAEDLWVPATEGGLTDFYPPNFPEEFKLAFALHTNEGESFDREGRDEM